MITVNAAIFVACVLIALVLGWVARGILGRRRR